MLISKETHTTCDFPGGGGPDPFPPGSTHEVRSDGEGVGEDISVFQVFRPLPRPVTYLILLVGPYTFI